MSHSAALPFVLRRSSEVIAEAGITSTEETVHGLLVLRGEHVLIQWRVDRRVDRIGPGISSDHETDPVREAMIPITGLASARMRSTWRQLFDRNGQLVLSASDIRTFEVLAGPGGLPLGHPGELIVGIRKADRGAAREFASVLDLAIAERALQRAEGGASDAYLEGEQPTQRALGRGDDSRQGL